MSDIKDYFEPSSLYRLASEFISNGDPEEGKRILRMVLLYFKRKCIKRNAQWAYVAISYAELVWYKEPSASEVLLEESLKIIGGKMNHQLQEDRCRKILKKILDLRELARDFQELMDDTLRLKREVAEFSNCMESCERDESEFLSDDVKQKQENMKITGGDADRLLSLVRPDDASFSLFDILEERRKNSEW